MPVGHRPDLERIYTVPCIDFTNNVEESPPCSSVSESKTNSYKHPSRSYEVVQQSRHHELSSQKSPCDLRQSVFIRVLFAMSLIASCLGVFVVVTNRTDEPRRCSPHKLAHDLLDGLDGAGRIAGRRTVDAFDETAKNVAGADLDKGVESVFAQSRDGLRPENRSVHLTDQPFADIGRRLTGAASTLR